MSDGFVCINASEDYERIVQTGDVKTTICRNRFEIIVRPNGEMWEQQVVQSLREWVRWRKEIEMRQSGGVSG